MGEKRKEFLKGDAKKRKLCVRLKEAQPLEEA
jgi:hypothetical protein